MIVCTNCGNHNEDSDEFCGSCGKFLEWVGERIEAPAAAAAEPVAEEETEQAKHGIVDRVKAAVGIDEQGRARPAEVPPEPTGPSLEEAAAAAAAESAQQARLEAEAAEATRRAAAAEEEAKRLAQAEADAKAKAEADAKERAEQDAKAEAEAQQRRQEEQAAERRRQDEAAALARAEAEAQRAAEAARLSQIEAERAAATEAEHQAAEEAAARQAEESRQAAAALEAARRAEEAARVAAEAEAAARAEADAKAKADAEARKQAESDARRQAEDETRARIQAEQRARDEEEARKRASALLSRPKAPAAPPPEAPSADPFVTPAAGAAPNSPDAMTPTIASAAPQGVRPVAQQPTAQQPAAAGIPRPAPKVTAAPDVVNAGDLVCSQCGVGNDPTRKFCRKCGNSLAKAVAAKKIPWWKKLLPGKKNRVSKDASDKERRRQKKKDASFKAQMAWANIRKVVMILMMAGIIGGAFAFPSLRGEIGRRASGGVGGIKNIFSPNITSVNALEPTATSNVAGREPKFANDLIVNTFWAEGAEGDGVGQTITFTFAEPIDLAKVLITAGSTDSTENYLNNPRPRTLHLVFDNGGSADLELTQDEFRKAQGFDLKGAKGVKKVDVVISSVYPGRGGMDTGIAEVEFKKKG